MTKQLAIAAIRRHLTTDRDENGAGLDAATAARGVEELRNLPDWVYELHRLEQAIGDRVATEKSISKQLAARLEKALPLARQLAHFNDGVGKAAVESLEQLNTAVTMLATGRKAARPLKMGPGHVAAALRGALQRSGISPRDSAGAIRVGLKTLGVTDPEIATALKKSNRKSPVIDRINSSENTGR